MRYKESLKCYQEQSWLFDKTLYSVNLRWFHLLIPLLLLELGSSKYSTRGNALANA